MRVFGSFIFILLWSEGEGLTLEEFAASHSESCNCLEQIAAPLDETLALRWENCWAFCANNMDCHVFSHSVTTLFQNNLYFESEFNKLVSDFDEEVSNLQQPAIRTAV